MALALLSSTLALGAVAHGATRIVTGSAVATSRAAPLSMATASSYDLLIIGGGSAGLTAAKFARTFDKSVAIIEKERLGGDCTWTGCVPSKTLLAIAKSAHAARTAAKDDCLAFSSPPSFEVDMRAVKAKVDAVVNKIYDEDDSPAALAALGIDTIAGAAHFVDASTLRVTPADAPAFEVRAAEGIVVATGAGPATPALEGLEGVPFITYEQIFSLETLPPRLTVVGGGPIGCELSQAFARLGSKVTPLRGRRVTST